MRDGVILRADIYRPNTPERLPALLSRTPYSKNPGRDDTARRLAAHGYVVVVQDTRGRYMSDGVARPHDEGEDGYDTIEWVAALPSVNGRVGTFGGSYSATTQLMAAPLRPPHLVAIVPFVVVQQPVRHGLSGRRVLSRRRLVLEPGSGGRRAPAPRCIPRRIVTVRSA